MAATAPPKQRSPVPVARRAARAGRALAYKALYGDRYESVSPPHRAYVRPGEHLYHEWSWKRLLARAPTMTNEEYAQRRELKEIEEFITCHVCGEERFQLLFHPRGKGYKGVGRHKWHYYVVRCPSCGHLYRNPNIKPERLGDLYAEKYSKFLASDYTAKRMRRYRLTLDAFTPWFDKGEGRRLLDFGCGNGIFLELAHERGFETYGVDLSPDSVEQAKQRPGGERTYCGTPLEVPEVAAGNFDVITMFSVLAHLTRPTDDLRMLRSLLSPNGMLLIFTVNANSLLLKADRSAWNGFTENHLMFFRKETLETIGKRAGFHSIETRPFYGDPIEAGTSKYKPSWINRLKSTIDRTDQGNMMRAVLFASEVRP